MKIDKGIELPPTTRKPSKWAFIADMEVGDSVLITPEFDKRGNASAYFYVWVRDRDQKDWRFAQRKTTEGVRVWRVK